MTYIEILLRRQQKLSEWRPMSPCRNEPTSPANAAPFGKRSSLTASRVRSTSWSPVCLAAVGYSIAPANRSRAA